MFKNYVSALAEALGATRATIDADGVLTVDEGLLAIRGYAKGLGNQKIIFVGNGGSAALASHMAIDYSKNGGVRAMAMNDPIALSCIANDFGVPGLFAQQVLMCGQKDDVLIAISSSGASQNILYAAAQAREMGMAIITLSGFDQRNPLRGLGDINFHVPSHVYGIVETAHQIILHAALDIGMGWTEATSLMQPKGSLRDDPLLA